MRFLTVSAALCAVSGVVQAAAVEKRDLLQDLQNQAMSNLEEAEENGTLQKRGGCSLFNAAVRKDW
jgi:tyrosinase